MGAVDLATGYVNLVPSARDIGSKIAEELDLDAVAVSAGKSAGEKLADGLVGQNKDTGEKLLKVLGFAAAGALAIKSAETVEGANNIIIRSTGATGAAADGLEASFRKVASGSSASLDVVATTLSDLYRRTGLQGEALEGLTKQVVTFNRITKDSPVTVDALTKALAGFNVPGKQMGDVLDHLFIISQKTGVPLSELLGTLQTAGPIARQFGLSVEDTATLLANLNKAGVDANQILPGLKKVFKDAADAGKDPQEALRGIIGQIDSLVKKGDEIGARNLAVQVFGPRGVGLVDAALAGKLSLKDFDTQLDTTGDGILDTAGKTGTLAGSLGVLRNNATLALAGFATPALEVANDALKEVLPTVQDLSAEFADLPDPIKLTGVAAVGAAVGIAQIGDFATNSLPGLVELKDKLVDVFTADAAVKGEEAATALDDVGASGFIASGGLGAAAGSLGLFTALAGGAALASFAIVDALDLGEASLSRFQRAGREAADAVVLQARATGDAYTLIASRRAALATKLHQFDDDLERRGIESANAVKDNTDAIISSLPDKAGVLFLKLRQEYDDLGVAQDRAAPKHKELVDQQKLEEEQAKRTASSLDTYAASTDAGTNASSALANLTDEAKKALSDLQSALIQAAGGQIAYQQSLIARDEAQQRANDADFAAFGAQLRYNDAVNQFGADSPQAVAAQDALTQAMRDNRSAQLDLQQSSLNVAQSAIALTDNEQKLLDSVGGTTEGIDAQIAKLDLQKKASPEAADALFPLILQLIALKAKIEEVPTGPQPPTTFSVDVQWANATSAAIALAALGGGANINPNTTGNAALDNLLGIKPPGAASGAIFDMPRSGGLAVLHGEEAVLPLNDPTRSWDLIAEAGLFDAMPTPKGAEGGEVNHWHVTVPTDDPLAFAVKASQKRRAAQFLGARR